VIRKKALNLFFWKRFGAFLINALIFVDNWFWDWFQVNCMRYLAAIFVVYCDRMSHLQCIWN
jgi:hypothetical protein